MQVSPVLPTRDTAESLTILMEAQLDESAALANMSTRQNPPRRRCPIAEQSRNRARQRVAPKSGPSTAVRVLVRPLRIADYQMKSDHGDFRPADWTVAATPAISPILQDQTCGPSKRPEMPADNW